MRAASMATMEAAAAGEQHAPHAARSLRLLAAAAEWRGAAREQGSIDSAL